MKNHHFFQNNYVFEFGEHNKIASATALFIENTDKKKSSKLFLRSDCKNIDFLGYLPPDQVIFLNKYFMLLALIICILFNRNVFITTLPEGASNFVVKIFQGSFLLFLHFYKKKIGLIVRDLKKNRARRFLILLKNKKIQIFAESLSLANTFKKILNREVHFLYTNFYYPRRKKIDKKYITFLGSIDKTRRDYEVAEKIINNLPNEKFLFLGHLSRTKYRKFFLYKFGKLKNIVAKKYFTNKEFDFYLRSTKVFININKQRFYRGVKGSGFLGDAFFGGTKCFVPQAMFNKYENKTLIPYSHANDVISKIRRKQIIFNIEKKVLNKKTKLFKNYIKDLFKYEC